MTSNQHKQIFLVEGSQPAKTPASISPALWQNDNRKEILTFLGDLAGAYLFYQVMQNDPDPQSSKVDLANAHHPAEHAGPGERACFTAQVARTQPPGQSYRGGRSHAPRPSTLWFQIM